MIGLFRNRDLVNDIDRRIRKEFNHTVRLHTLSTDHMEVLKELDFSSALRLIMGTCR